MKMKTTNHFTVTLNQNEDENNKSLLSHSKPK